MTPCPTSEQLQRLLMGELPAAEFSSLEAHVEQCPLCRQALERLTDDPAVRPAKVIEPPAQTPTRSLHGQPAGRVEPERPNGSGTADFQGPADAPSLDFLAPATRPDALGRLGHYEVLQVLGRGGFGIVFRAFDDVLQRVVAIKVLSPALAATSPARKRFLREARSAAQLRQENVVQIYAVEEQPLPYLVMEFVPGEALQQRLDRTGPFEAAEGAAIGRQIAEGLAAAHAAGLIHRDIKPGNLLLEEGPRLRVKITDFGLARAADDASITQSGVVAGTPLYMSPEQARGERLDHRTDLFSLGSVLYAITSGRPPFRAGNALAVLKRVAEDTPRPIPEIIPETPEWLCRIIVRLMAKDPAERFQTAAAVSAALEAEATPPPVVPQAPPPAPRLRRRLLAGATLALTVGLIVSAYLLTRPDPTPEGNPDSTGKNREENGLLKSRPAVPLPTPEALAARPAAADALRRENLPFLQRAGLPKEVVAVLGESSRFHYPRAQTDRNRARMSKDGNLLAAPSGQDGKVELFDATTGAHLYTLEGPGYQIRDVAFSTASDLLAGIAYWPDLPPALRVWDLRTRKELFTYTGKGGSVEGEVLRHPTLSPDGQLVAASQIVPTVVRVWVARTGEQVKILPDVGGPVEFSPDGKLLAVPKDLDKVVLFRTDTWEVSHVLPCEREEISDLHFSPDGSLLAVSNRRGLQVWKTDDFKEFRRFEMPMYAFAFFPDGRTIMAKSTDNTLPVHTYTRWDVTTGAKKGAFSVASPKPDYQYFSLSPDGKSLIVVDFKWLPRVRVFDPKTGQDRFGPTKHDGPVLAVAVSPNGTTVASAGAGADTRIHLWDLATGQLVRMLPARPESQGTLAFSPDGKTLASGSANNGAITFWDWRTGKEAGVLTGQGRTVSQLAFSPDGKLLAFRVAFGETKLYEVATKKVRVIDPGGFDGDGCVAFSPDGKTLASGGSDKVLRLFDVATGGEVGALAGHDDVIRWAGFRPDGRAIAFCGGLKDRLIRHWSLAPPAARPALRGHTSGVLSCAWRGDGKLLASAGLEDGTVRLWGPDANPPRSQTIMLFPPQQGRIHALALTPEGRHLVTGNVDGTIYVLRLAKVGEVLRVP